MEMEVTRWMWQDLRSVQPDLPVDPTDEQYGAAVGNPVQNVTWFESILFAKLSVINGLDPCCQYGRSANRNYFSPGDRKYVRGFRMVRTVL